MRVVKRLWACRNGRSKTSGDARTTDIFANLAKGGPRRPGMQVIPRLILNFLTKEYFLSILNRQGTIASGGGKKMPRQANLLRRVQPVEVRMESRVSDPLPEMGQTAFQGKNLSLPVRVWVEMLKQDVTILLAGAGRFLHRNFPPQKVKGPDFLVDVVAEVRETAYILAQFKATGVIFWGGRTLKKFIQQTEKINFYCDSNTAFRLMVTAGIQESAAFPYHCIRPEMKKSWSWPPKTKFPLKAKMSHNK